MHNNWGFLARVIIGIPAIFYFSVWVLESGRAGSWRAGHAAIWKKPRKWERVTFAFLWGLIVIGLVVLFFTRR
jgi:hypothetical protein